MLPADSNTWPQHFSIHISKRDGIDVITMTGEIDYGVSGPLHEVLQDHAEKTGRIVVDFAGISFMDSTGISALVAAAQALRSRPGKWLRIAAPSDPVRRTLALVGLDSILDIYPTLAEALSA